jgi:hypothetical protein
VQVWAYNIEVTAINHFIGSGPFARALRYWAHFHVAPAAAARCDHDDEGRPLARGFKLSELVRSACSAAECGAKTINERAAETLLFTGHSAFTVLYACTPCLQLYHA